MGQLSASSHKNTGPNLMMIRPSSQSPLPSILDPNPHHRVPLTEEQNRRLVRLPSFNPQPYVDSLTTPVEYKFMSLNNFRNCDEAELRFWATPVIARWKGSLYAHSTHPMIKVSNYTFLYMSSLNNEYLEYLGSAIKYYVDRYGLVQECLSDSDSVGDTLKRLTDLKEKEKLASLKLLEGFARLNFHMIRECLREQFRMLGEYLSSGDEDSDGIHRFRLSYAVYLLAVGKMEEAGLLFFHAVVNGDTFDDLISPLDLVLYSVLTNVKRLDCKSFKSQIMNALIVKQNLDNVPWLSNFVRLITLKRDAEEFDAKEFDAVLGIVLCHMNMDRYMAVHAEKYHSLLVNARESSDVLWDSISYLGGRIPEAGSTRFTSEMMETKGYKLWYTRYTNLDDDMYDQLVRYSMGEAISFGFVSNESEKSDLIPSKLFDAGKDKGLIDQSIHSFHPYQTSILSSCEASPHSVVSSLASSKDFKSASSLSSAEQLCDDWLSDAYQAIQLLGSTASSPVATFAPQKPLKPSYCQPSSETPSAQPASARSQHIIDINEVEDSTVQISKDVQGAVKMTSEKRETMASFSDMPSAEPSDAQPSTKAPSSAPAPSSPPELHQPSYCQPSSETPSAQPASAWGQCIIDINKLEDSTVQISKDVQGAVKMTSRSTFPATKSGEKRETMVSFSDMPSAEPSDAQPSTKAPSSAPAPSSPLESDHSTKAPSLAPESDHRILNLKKLHNSTFINMKILHNSTVQFAKDVSGNVDMTSNEVNMSGTQATLSEIMMSSATTSPSPTTPRARYETIGIRVAAITCYLAIMAGVYAFFANQAEKIKPDFYTANLGGFIVATIFEIFSLILLGFKAFLLRKGAGRWFDTVRPWLDNIGYGVVYFFVAGVVLLLSELFIHQIAFRVLLMVMWTLFFIPIAVAWDRCWRHRGIEGALSE